MDVSDRTETYTNVLARVSTEVFSKWHRVLATLCPLSPVFPVLPTRCEWTLARACVWMKITIFPSKRRCQHKSERYRNQSHNIRPQTTWRSTCAWMLTIPPTHSTPSWYESTLPPNQHVTIWTYIKNMWVNVPSHPTPPIPPQKQLLKKHRKHKQTCCAGHERSACSASRHAAAGSNQTGPRMQHIDH